MAERFRGLTAPRGWVHRVEGGQRIGAARLIVSTEKMSLQMAVDDHIAAALGRLLRFGDVQR